MGTRALTIVTDGTNEIIVMYRQHDGYPDCHGKKLAAFLEGMRVVNGLGVDDGKVANGAGCLAAQLVAAFKTKPGGIYLHPAGTRDCWEQYVYTIAAHAPRDGAPGRIDISVTDDDGKSLFSGDVTSFAVWCQRGQIDDEDDVAA